MVQEDKREGDEQTSCLSMYALAAARHQPFTVECRSQASVRFEAGEVRAAKIPRNPHRRDKISLGSVVTCWVGGTEWQGETQEL